ncbi:MAG TPA: tryptophan 2,3-dioxygenase family protein [Polyangiaceae bacterium]|jgi:tryptophan 2,3-dioxygenase|nr:tryptophan 2,3-dioxygenase family protein [Polyangiaceae bacterium]
MALTYGRYLRLGELLAVQHPLSSGPEHDEMLFIVIHQIYELWFKQVLHETAHLQAGLEKGDTHHALGTLKRMLTILKTLVAQVDVLETMTPTSFATFRARLDTASGFESVQFRRLEFALGYKRRSALEHYPEGSDERTELEESLEARTLWDSFLGYLAGQGFPVPAAALARDVREPVEGSVELEDVLLLVYRQNALVSQVCERLVDLDEGLQEWRYRHVKMVERTIGTKNGSGGSSGVEYLRRTLFRPLFPDLWAIRARL